MGQFILRRTLYAIATLFILSLTIFLVVRLTGLELLDVTAVLLLALAALVVGLTDRKLVV